MLKKFVSVICTALVFALLFAGCGKGTEPAPAAGSSAASANVEAPEKAANPYGLSDGVYTVYVETDSSMFHVNETKEGKGELTVSGDQMTVHMTLVSKNIVNLFPGKAADAEAAEAAGQALIEPTTDEVTYSDGTTEEVYGFDVPVTVMDEPFDLAIIGTKGKWYDHTVTISNPQPAN